MFSFLGWWRRQLGRPNKAGEGNRGWWWFIFPLSVYRWINLFLLVLFNCLNELLIDSNKFGQPPPDCSRSNWSPSVLCWLLGFILYHLPFFSKCWSLLSCHLALLLLGTEQKAVGRDKWWYLSLMLFQPLTHWSFFLSQMIFKAPVVRKMLVKLPAIHTLLSVI